MTTATATYNWSGSSQGNVFALISATRSLITSTGLISVADNAPSIPGDVSYSSGAPQGGITWRFPDSLQTTMPIFVRVDFNLDSSYRAYVNCTVGSALNSSTAAPTSPNVYMTGNPSTYQDNLTSYACYIDGTFGVVLGWGATSSGQNCNSILALTIDRDRNASGVAQGSGYLAEMLGAPFTPTVYSRSLYGTGSPDVSSNFIPSLVPSGTAVTTAEGANVNVFRHYSMTPGVKPHVGMLTYFNSEFGALTPFTATVLGAQHTYMPMGYAMNYWSASPQKAHCCAIRWE